MNDVNVFNTFRKVCRGGSEVRAARVVGVVFVDWSGWQDEAPTEEEEDERNSVERGSEGEEEEEEEKEEEDTAVRMARTRALSMHHWRS